MSEPLFHSELLQKNFNETNLYDLCYRFFTESTYYSQVKKELSKVKTMLGQTGAGKTAAESILEVLDKG